METYKINMLYTLNSVFYHNYINNTVINFKRIPITSIQIPIYNYFLYCLRISHVQFSSVQSRSHVWLFATPWTAAFQASLSITNCQSLLKLMPIKSVMAIQSSHPLSSPSPPALNLPQNQALFKWVSSSHQVAKVLEFQLQHQSFQWMIDFL